MLKIARREADYMVELFRVDRLNTLFVDLVEKQLLELFERAEDTPVIFNLANVHFIDSAGFKMLVNVANRASEKGCNFKLCNVSEEVRELIGLMDLEGRFNICSQEISQEKILAVLD